jgi:hypothetical protein
MKLEDILARWTHLEAAASGVTPSALLAGRWVNEHGSVAELTVEGDRIGGTFMTTVGSVKLTGPISGFVRGDIVAFSVLWPESTHSLSAWVGQLVDHQGEPALKTSWHLVVDIPDAEEPAGQWATVLTGSDTFR